MDLGGSAALLKLTGDDTMIAINSIILGKWIVIDPNSFLWDKSSCLKITTKHENRQMSLSYL
jgi:hypothetical protein